MKLYFTVEIRKVSSSIVIVLKVVCAATSAPIRSDVLRSESIYVLYFCVGVLDDKIVVYLPKGTRTNGHNCLAGESSQNRMSIIQSKGHTQSIKKVIQKLVNHIHGHIHTICPIINRHHLLLWLFVTAFIQSLSSSICSLTFSRR